VTTSSLTDDQVFRFFIKTRTAAPKPTFLVPPPLVARISDTMDPATPLVEGKRTPLNVLIVEDNVINQTVLRRQIVKAGSSCQGTSLYPRLWRLIVVVADNGQIALDKLDVAEQSQRSTGQGLYDIVLMDLEMPG
jgi:hypothetical protein